jgi:hypothetical protein
LIPHPPLIRGVLIPPVSRFIVGLIHESTLPLIRGVSDNF